MSCELGRVGVAGADRDRGLRPGLIRGRPAGDQPVDRDAERGGELAKHFAGRTWSLPALDERNVAGAEIGFCRECPCRESTPLAGDTDAFTNAGIHEHSCIREYRCSQPRKMVTPSRPVARVESVAETVLERIEKAGKARGWSSKPADIRGASAHTLHPHARTYFPNSHALD